MAMEGCHTFCSPCSYKYNFRFYVHVLKKMGRTLCLVVVAVVDVFVVVVVSV
jgi:hypothetical protein